MDESRDSLLEQHLVNDHGLIFVKDKAHSAGVARHGDHVLICERASSASRRGRRSLVGAAHATADITRRIQLFHNTIMAVRSAHPLSMDWESRLNALSIRMRLRWQRCRFSPRLVGPRAVLVKGAKIMRQFHSSAEAPRPIAL